MWALSIRRRWPKLPLACSSGLALGLAWLPEILLFLGELELEMGGGVFSLFSGVAPDFEGAELLHLKVNGMGCEACQLHVRTTLEMSAGVQQQERERMAVEGKSSGHFRTIPRNMTCGDRPPRRF